MDAVIDVALLLLPLFLTMAGGYILGRFFDLSVDTLVRVLTDLVAPLMIFRSLYDAELSGGMLARLSLASFFVVLSLALVAYVWTRNAGLDRRAYLPPILFYNTGFLGIPLMQLWGGVPAVNVILVYDQMQGVAIFTLGIFIVAGGFSLKGMFDMFKSPIVWAMVAGFAFNFARIPVPKAILDTCAFGGSAMGSLAAITLGASLVGKTISFDSRLFVGLLLRTVGGFFAGVGAALLFGLEGLTKTVFIVGSALPSAVFSYVITTRYGARTEFSSAMVVTSTAFGVVSIPLAFWAAGFF